MITAWLIGLGFSRTSAKWVLRAAAVLAIGAAFAGAYVAGYSAGSARKEIQQTKVDLAQARKSIEKLQRLETENAQLTNALNEERQRERVVYRTIREKVPHVVKEIIEVPSPGALPECRVTNSFVWLWDDASFARVPQAAGSTANGPARVGSPGASAGIGFAELLDNHITNAELGSEIRRQCQALIEWHRSLP